MKGYRPNITHEQALDGIRDIIRDTPIGKIEVESTLYDMYPITKPYLSDFWSYNREMDSFCTCTGGGTILIRDFMAGNNKREPFTWEVMMRCGSYGQK